MPQGPPKRWKRATFTAIAQLEHALRGTTLLGHTDLRQIRNFLLLQYDVPLGSVVHATPVFEALKNAIPDVHVTVAASSMAASVLGNNPFIDRCIVTANPASNFRKALQKVHELLASMPPGPRCILTTTGNRRPRVALLAVLAGKALRVGHTAAPELYHLPLKFDPERSQIEGNLDIARALGHQVALCEPQIFFTRQDADHAAQLLREIPEKSGETRIALITRNSGGQPNRWATDRFREVIAVLSQEMDAVPIFVGSHTDAAAIESLRQSVPNAGISLAGKTNVSQLAAILTQCDLTVSLDTGPFHVARAAGLPGVVIAPAWQNSLEWLPVGNPRYRVLRGPSIPLPRSDYSMEEIGVEQVTQAAMELMKEFPPSIETRNARLHRGLTIRKPS